MYYGIKNKESDEQGKALLSETFL